MNPPGKSATMVLQKRRWLTVGYVLFTAGPVLPANAAAPSIETLKKEAREIVRANTTLTQQMVDSIFSFSELGFQEFETSAYVTGILEKEGFSVTRGVAGMPTAFVASWGSGKPFIGFMADIDGLPETSQKPGVAYHAPLIPGGPGHGEGHNAGQAVNVTAAIAVKRLMQKYNIPGTIRVYPGVAEELLASRTYMVNTGLFHDLDVMLSTHISSDFGTKYGPGNSGLVSTQYSFHGQSAHASSSPWKGRSALDAVELKSDVEIGATEQKFNLLVHRDIQREYGLVGEVALTVPILVGLDGKRKMSKSLGNYVGITETPNEMFGKIMSIPDDLMWSYYELLTDRTPQEIAALKQEVASGKLHPRQVKEDLAKQVVDDFHRPTADDVTNGVPSSVTIGTSTAAEFNRVYRDRQAPTEMTEIRLKRVPGGLMYSKQLNPNIVEETTISLSSGLIKWSKLLADLGQVSSTSEAERVIKQNGFEVNGAQIIDPTNKLNVDIPSSHEVRFGRKKFLRIIVE